MTEDLSDTDWFGFSWVGRIEAESVFQLRLRAGIFDFEDGLNTIETGTAWASYELYPECYPLDNNF